MLSYAPTSRSPEGTTRPVFNILDFSFSSTYATLADLLNYANLYGNNVFFGNNSFISLQFSSTINNVSTTTFNYIANLTSDAQTQLNTINQRLTNYIYDIATNTQSLITNTSFTNNVLSANQINNNTLLAGSIVSNTINTNSIFTNTLTCPNLLVIPCYIYNSNNTYPIMKSNVMSNLTNINFNYPIYVTIAPNYQINFIDVNNNIISNISNVTNDFIYYQNITFSVSYPPVSFNLFIP